MGGQPRSTLLALLLALSGGCMTSEQYSEQADDEVLPMLEETQAATLGDRESWMQQPEPAAQVEPDEDDGHIAPPALPEPPADAEHVTLSSSLKTAFTSSREFLNEQENLYLQGLGLSLTRYDFGPILDATIAALWQDDEHSQSQTSVKGLLGVTQILPQGGTFGLAGTLGGTAIGGVAAPGLDDPSYDSSAIFSLEQPLLRGFGYEVSHEALTQGERDLVYSVRDFELFREDFSISIADDYFSLVSRRQQLRVLQQTYEDSIFDQHKAEAMRLVDRNQDEDVFLARRRAIDIENQLLSEQADYLEAVDRFKVRLGLPADVPVVVDEDEPPYLPVSLDPDSAVAVALHNRLDVQSASERLEDDERHVRIAADALRAQLDLTVIGGLAGDDGNPAGAFPDDWNTSAALALGLPVNRQAERNAYRSDQIALDQARRDYDTLLDEVGRDVRNLLRQIRTIELQVELQRQQIAQERRAVAVSEIRYEAGDVDNRDLLDARASLARAQNDLIRLLAQHLSSRLRLLKAMGVLVIREDGSWAT